MNKTHRNRSCLIYAEPTKANCKPSEWTIPNSMVKIRPTGLAQINYYWADWPQDPRDVLRVETHHDGMSDRLCSQIMVGF